MSKETKIRVRCHGTFHNVVIEATGNIRFPEHSREEMNREAAMVKLGGSNSHGCAAFLRKWRDFDFNKDDTVIPSAVQQMRHRQKQHPVAYRGCLNILKRQWAKDNWQFEQMRDANVELCFNYRDDKDTCLEKFTYAMQSELQRRGLILDPDLQMNLRVTCAKTKYSVQYPYVINILKPKNYPSLYIRKYKGNSILVHIGTTATAGDTPKVGLYGNIFIPLFQAKHVDSGIQRVADELVFQAMLADSVWRPKSHPNCGNMRWLSPPLLEPRSVYFRVETDAEASVLNPVACVRLNHGKISGISSYAARLIYEKLCTLEGFIQKLQDASYLWNDSYEDRLPGQFSKCKTT